MSTLNNTIEIDKNVDGKAIIAYLRISSHLTRLRNVRFLVQWQQSLVPSARCYHGVVEVAKEVSCSNARCLSTFRARTVRVVLIGRSVWAARLSCKKKRKCVTLPARKRALAEKIHGGI